MNHLVIATSNPGKVIEIRSGLGEIGGWSLTALPAGIPDIEETGETFLENAELKARHYSKYVEDLTLADDSGLCVDALGGRPGVHSARYEKDPAARIERLLGELKSVPHVNRTATFYCAVALARRGDIVWTVQCDVHGWIGVESIGTKGFGYDPVFILPELNRTMAQLTTGEKNRLSARGKALAEVRKYLTS